MATLTLNIPANPVSLNVLSVGQVFSFEVDWDLTQPIVPSTVYMVMNIDDVNAYVVLDLVNGGTTTFDSNEPTNAAYRLEIDGLSVILQ